MSNGAEWVAGSRWEEIKAGTVAQLAKEPHRLAARRRRVRTWACMIEAACGVALAVTLVKIIPLLMDRSIAVHPALTRWLLAP
jgi:hypothetical protein